ncbi:MAG: PDZ domain-containing protein [Candidatus Omnitrophica bacterium]|nr:PDZ domain-containing protein [Candidatus Omnitrophota bacterium]MBU0895546.1 PDZ domain-containing protein [Candidatus Omnitrophota bacterium]MBU1038212.1 PDZ domain-containing protein [Candidatus Omnitrophota bacterium]MBU1808863.1 PDZ domain-containing protein [Candidatus Omnitrophota bacterium]
MKIYKCVLLVVLSVIYTIGCAVSLFADTITTNDRKEIKGIVVEDYKDRVLFSTVDGEIMMMKSDMRELLFDSEEDNLVKLAEQASERRDYSRAMSYYEMALKINPDSTTVRQGMAYLRGNVFRKEESLKTAEIKRQQDMERYGSQRPAIRRSDDIDGMTKTLEKTTGLKISIEDSLPVIDDLKPDSPAYEAGLRRGDILVSVWSKLTGYLSLKEILDLLVNKSAIEINCVIERVTDVPINPDKTMISGLEDLIGASFTMEMDGLTISAVKESGSGAYAGLQNGDLVIAIDGQQTRYMPLKKAIELIKRSDEENVKLTIRRKAAIWRNKDI